MGAAFQQWLDEATQEMNQVVHGYATRQSATTRSSQISSASRLRRAAEAKAQPIQMIPLNSRVIKEAGYDPPSQKLEIRFTSGSKHYSFYRVPATVFHELLKAPSAGRYYDRNIRGKYRIP